MAGRVLMNVGVFQVLKDSDYFLDNHRPDNRRHTAADESAKRFQPFHGKGSCVENLGAACPYRSEQAATESRQALQYANVQWTHPALPARLPDVVARAQCKRERLPCYFYHARRGRCGKFLNLFSVTRRTVFSLLNNFGLFIPPGRLVALPGHLVTLSGAGPGP
jgi:hypothetical protein